MRLLIPVAFLPVEFRVLLHRDALHLRDASEEATPSCKAYGRTFQTPVERHDTNSLFLNKEEV